MLDHNRDIGETDTPIQEGLDRDLVGRIQDGAGRATGLEGLAGQPQTGEPQRVRCLEVEPCSEQQIQRTDPGVDALGPARAWAMGVRMSGLPSWASTEPST